MDRSRITAALPEAAFARALEAAAGADIVIVDLSQHGDDIGALRAAAPGAWIVAYGSHVDEAALAQARADSADVVLPRSKFFHDPAAAVARDG